MKKLFLFSLPILFLFGLFVFNPLDSYAYTLDNDYSVIHTISVGGNDLYTRYTTLPRSNIIFYKDGNDIFITTEAEIRSTYLGQSSSAVQVQFVYSENENFEPVLGNGSYGSVPHSLNSVFTYNGIQLYVDADCPIFSSRNAAVNFLILSLYDESYFLPDFPLPEAPIGGVSGDESIPAPHVHWGQKTVTYNNKTYKVYNKSLYFDNYVYDNANHSKWYLELHYAWSTVRGGSMGKGDSNSFRFYYDDTDLVFQTTQNSSFIKPIADSSTPSDFMFCPGVIHFNSGEFLTSYNSFLADNPISSSQFNYSLGQTPLASLFWNSDNLADVNFAFNCPLVVCRYYRLNDDGSVNYGPWTSSSLGMPDTGCYCYLLTDGQGQRLGVFNSKAYTDSDDKPEPGGTTPGTDPKPGGDPDPSDKPIPDPDPSGDVNLSDLVDSLDSIFDFLKTVPNFFRVLFSFLPSWLIDLLAICIALAIIIGLVKLVF